MDEAISTADAHLWKSFREWMAANESPWLLWTLHEHHNNHEGMLQVYLSRNHRASPFWEMLQWIAEHGPGSNGLFYVHDDEDGTSAPYGRVYDNVFRVHRIMNGRVDELPDPFFGPIVPSLQPVHPYDRNLAVDDDDSETEFSDIRRRLADVVGWRAYNQLIESVSDVQQRGRLRFWQEQLLQRAGEKGVVISTAEELVRLLDGANLAPPPAEPPA